MCACADAIKSRGISLIPKDYNGNTMDLPRQLHRNGERIRTVLNDMDIGRVQVGDLQVL